MNMTVADAFLFVGTAIGKKKRMTNDPAKQRTNGGSRSRNAGACTACRSIISQFSYRLLVDSLIGYEVANMDLSCINKIYGHMRYH